MLYYLFMTCFTKKQEPVKNMGDVTTLRAFSYLRISDRDLVRKATSNWFLLSLVAQAYRDISKEIKKATRIEMFTT